MVAISVIIPAYNEENYLRPTLYGLKQQTFQNFETIVVANGCTDKTEEIVGKRINERLQLLKMPQANVSRARNHGASKAKGEILVFLDADTVLDRNALQKINSGFTGDYSIGTTKVRPDQTDYIFKLHSGIKNAVNWTKLYKGWVSGVLVCRKKQFDAVNGYEHQREVREHRDLILRLLKLGQYVHIDTYATTSMRRFQQWGLLKAAGFWLKQLVLDNLGDITKSKYEKIR